MPQQAPLPIRSVAHQIITPEARGGGSFADPIPAPDAGLLDRPIAFTGRTINP